MPFCCGRRVGAVGILQSLKHVSVFRYRLETVDDWTARVRTRGHIMVEEKQLKFHIERYGDIAHLWSSYVLNRGGEQVARHQQHSSNQ
jgi:hypothetical protein